MKLLKIDNMKHYNTLWVLCIFLSWTNLNAQTLDVNFTGNTGNCGAYIGVSETQTIAQSFTAGMSGYLTSVKVGLSTEACTLTDVMHCKANIYDGTCADNVITSEDFTVPTGLSLSMFQINFETPVYIVSGQVYTLELSVISGQDCYNDLMMSRIMPVFGRWHLENPDNCGGEYAGGTAYEPGCSAGNYDLYIQTYVSESVNILATSFEHVLLIYPNPTKENVAIDLGSVFDTSEISITDVNGKLIYTKVFTNSKNLYFSIKEPAGIYIISVKAGDKQAAIRLIKE